MTINRRAHELYAFWRSPENLVRVMENIQSIEPIDDRRSRWTVKAPAGREVSWESVVTNDVPDEAITWQSAEGADVANSGRIEFIETKGRGTVVRATMAYDPPGCTIGKLIAKLFQREPRIQTRREALERLGVAVETLETDLATLQGVDRLLDQAGGRAIDLLCANAGHGLGDAFLKQDVSA